jgi:hypothetical protein
MHTLSGHNECALTDSPLHRSLTPKAPPLRGQLGRRLRGGLFLLLNVGLLYILLNFLSISPVASQDLFGLYYAPLFPLVIMLWFWSFFVAYAERRHVRYEVCFSSEDQKYLMHSDKLFLVRFGWQAGRQLPVYGWQEVVGSVHLWHA